jgi:hypothetical protein
MAKQLIKEAHRMQQLAGLINENYVDLMPINSPFMESEEIYEADVTDTQIQMKYFEMMGKNPQTKEEDVAEALGIDVDRVRGALSTAYRAMKTIKFENEEDDDMEDSESNEEEYDFTSPGKKDEFDTDDDVEPTAKDVKAGDALAKTAGGKQGKLTMLMKRKDAILNKFKSGEITIDQYKAEIGDIPMQIKQLQADIDRDLTVDDEDEY